MNENLKALIKLFRLGVVILAARWEGKNLESFAQRAAWQQHQARRMLAALEVEISVSGHLPNEGLVVCNHLSYLDVLLIAAQGRVVFVAKSDVREWPVVGKLLECAGTILAERGHPLTASRTSAEIRRVLGEGIPVVLFPEGTSSDGSKVLPFKPTLLQCALDAKAPITPAAISYSADGGNALDSVCYWGEATFFPHLIRLARLRKVIGVLSFGTPAHLSSDRKLAAMILQSEVDRLTRK